MKPMQRKMYWKEAPKKTVPTSWDPVFVMAWITLLMIASDIQKSIVCTEKNRKFRLTPKYEKMAIIMVYLTPRPIP